jgi:hypothetical protein
VTGAINSLGIELQMKVAHHGNFHCGDPSTRQSAR